MSNRLTIALELRGRTVEQTIDLAPVLCAIGANEPIIKLPDCVWIAAGTKPGTWEIFGVFETEENARAACTSRDHFTARMRFNVATNWDEQRWPLRESDGYAQ